ncbi:MAG: type II toxin-antitoxin system Phd/YefM family antitoxin [Candidatus Binataceae bacterium]
MRDAKRTWQLQQAKNRLSEVVDRARREGPQTITLRGRAAAVVLSAEDYRRVSRPKVSLLDFLLNSPLRGSRLRADRLKSPP